MAQSPEEIEAELKTSREAVEKFVKANQRVFADSVSSSLNATLYITTRTFLRTLDKSLLLKIDTEHLPAWNAPPGGFTFLLACVAKPGRAEELLGDAEAEFHQMEVRLGRRRARWWYRVHVVTVIVRMVPSYIWRIFVVKKLLGL